MDKVMLQKRYFLIAAMLMISTAGCVFENPSLESTNSASAPSAPIIGIAVAGNHSATVTFSPSLASKDSSITVYTATSNPGGLTSTSPASPIIVGGLSNGVSYTFTVTARNALGSSPPSAASNAVRPSAQSLVLNDDGNSAAGLGSGINLGTGWAGGQISLSAGGTPINNSGLESSWTPQWSSAIAYWSFELAPGKNTNPSVEDLVGNHTGTLNGNVTLGVGGKLNTSAAFDGSGAFISVADNPNLRFTSAQSFTLQLWAYPTSFPGTWQALVQKGVDHNNWYGLWMSPDHLWTYGIVGANMSGPQATLNTWTHLVLVQDVANNRHSLYVNGALAATAPGTYDAGIDPAGVLTIGSSPLGENYNGRIDDVALWSTALDANDIASIYSRESAQYAGTFTSRILSTGSSNSWKGFSWKTTLPFGKELPDNGLSESTADYPLVTENLMSGNQGLWHFNELTFATGGSSKDFKDTSQNGQWGQAVNLVTLAEPGQFSKAVHLDGSTAYINMGQTPTTLDGADKTISAWIRPTTLGNAGIVEKYFDNGGSDYGGWSFVMQWNGKLWFWVQRSQDLQDYGPLTVQTNQWNHVAVTYNHTTNAVRFYINGQLNSEYTNAATEKPSGAANFVVGVNLSQSIYFPGSIDELGIWNRVLSDGRSGSPNEILDLYRRGANRIKFQIRTCVLASCSDDPHWIGPDGTSTSYFSEMQNNDLLGPSGNPLGQVLKRAPDLNFTDFTGLSIPALRYFQYRAIFETDDVGTACNGMWCSPELLSVAIKPL